MTIFCNNFKKNVKLLIIICYNFYIKTIYKEGKSPIKKNNGEDTYEENLMCRTFSI